MNEPPIKINRRERVPCFGNEPKTDLELLRRIAATHASNEREIKIMVGGLIVAGIIAAIVAVWLKA